MGLIKDLEKVQMRATKLVRKLKHLKYKERLERLKLPTLRYRRTRGDMIEVYKILTESYCKSVNLELELHKKSVTRGHNLGAVTEVHPRVRVRIWVPRVNFHDSGHNLTRDATMI